MHFHFGAGLKTRHNSISPYLLSSKKNIIKNIKVLRPKN